MMLILALGAGCIEPYRRADEETATDSVRETDSLSDTAPDAADAADGGTDTTDRDASVIPVDTGDTEDAGRPVDTAVAPDAGLDTSTESDSDTSQPSSDDTESTSTLPLPVTSWNAPKNMILFIGDGMGPNHVAAAGIQAYGAPGTLFFESFPVQGLVTVRAANAEIPDSAASSTAMATGHKVDLGVVALEIPGSGAELPTVIDFFKHKRKATGLITNSFMTDATPAGFAGHAVHRSDFESIAWHYLNTGRPEVFLGGGGYAMSLGDATAAGYAVATTRDELANAVMSGTQRICGLFGGDRFPYEYDGLGDFPHLFEIASDGISFLSQDPDGYFVMVEGALIDKASHINDLPRVLDEVLGFETTVQTITTAVDLSDTLIIVTADHQTGGLIVDPSDPYAIAHATWTTNTHNAGPVSVYVIGKGSEIFETVLEARGGVIDNTDIYKILTLPSV